MLRFHNFFLRQKLLFKVFNFVKLYLIIENYRNSWFTYKESSIIRHFWPPPPLSYMTCRVFKGFTTPISQKYSLIGNLMFKVSHEKAIWHVLNLPISELLRNLYFDFFSTYKLRQQFNSPETAAWKCYIIFGNWKFDTYQIAFLMRYFKH